MGLTCGLFILVVLVTTTSAAPLEEIDRVLDDLILLEELKEILAEKKGTMSGIEVGPEITTVFNEMKLRSTNKWCTFKIENKRKVVVDECRAGDATLMNDKDKQAWEELVGKLTTEPRYILYDISFTNRFDGREIKKIFFMFWCPESARLGDKMIYASTKDTVKKAFTGLSLEFQANGREGLKYEPIKDEVERKAK